MAEKENENLRKLTVKEWLIGEYNDHIVKYVKNLVEATFCGGRPQDEVVITIIQESGNPNLPPMERKIKAKDAQIRARKELDKQDSILRVIDRLIKAEEKKETKFE